MATYNYSSPMTESTTENPAPQGGFKLQEAAGELVAVTCISTFSIVLSHGCEIDQDRKHRMVALVRPLSSNIDPEHQDIIRQNRNYQFFYLPEWNKLPESYVDLRRVSCLGPSYVDSGNRLASLSASAVERLYVQWIRFVTRRDIDLSALTVEST